jgi:benzylsuccinate CoA-transferase BbsF subunit
MSRPLTGLRILDFSHVLAGPFATRILGDMGADVVRVNSARRATGANQPGSPYYVSFNRNKRSLALDMSLPESQALAGEMALRADIVIDNFSPGVLDRWGVGYQAVRQVNPGVIYIEMSGMGDTGPWSRFVTFAPTIHALAGLTHLTGVPGREDIGIGFSYNDHQAGLHGAFAILAALEARRRTGEGQRIDVSQFELGVNFSGPSLLDWFGNGAAARPTGNRLPYDAVAPHGCYRCLSESPAVVDEEWVAIACMDDDQWAALKAVMGHPAWANDTALSTAPGRLTCADLDARVEAWTRTRTAVEVMTRCQAAGVPAGVVQDAVDLMEHDPQLAHDGFLNETLAPHPVLGRTFYDRLAIRFSRTPCNEYPVVSELGADNASVLADWVGMSEDEVNAAAAAGLLK